MANLSASKKEFPSCRKLTGIHIATVRHLPGDHAVLEAVNSIHLPWPVRPGEIIGNGPYLAWRSPSESILFSTSEEPITTLLATLDRKKSPLSVGFSVSEAYVIHEMKGRNVDRWLAHLVDEMAIPVKPGSVRRGRMGEIAVFLMRLTADTVWAVVDRSMEPYFSNWITYSFEGAFAD